MEQHRREATENPLHGAPDFEQTVSVALNRLIQSPMGKSDCGGGCSTEDDVAGEHPLAERTIEESGQHKFRVESGGRGGDESASQRASPSHARLGSPSHHMSRRRQNSCTSLGHQ